VGWTQSQYGLLRRENVLPFEPQTVQPVASRYKNYAVPYLTIIIIIIIIKALKTKYYATKILKTETDSKCRLCHQFDETT
jgi:hypothetical protein